MRCDEVIGELAVPSDDCDSAALAEHLAQCPACRPLGPKGGRARSSLGGDPATGTDNPGLGCSLATGCFLFRSPDSKRACGVRPARAIA